MIKEIIYDIKICAKTGANLITYYKGNEVAYIVIPKKQDDETWDEYMRQYEFESRADGCVLVINFGKRGSINMLIDSWSTY